MTGLLALLVGGIVLALLAVIAATWMASRKNENTNVIDINKIKSSEELYRTGKMKSPFNEPAQAPSEKPLRKVFSKESVAAMSADERMQLLRNECREDGHCPVSLMFVLDDVVTDRKERVALHKACVEQRNAAVARLVEMHRKLQKLAAHIDQMEALDELSEVCLLRQEMFFRILRSMRKDLNSEDVAIFAAVDLKLAWAELHACIAHCSAGCPRAQEPLHEAAQGLKEKQADFCPTIEH